MDYGKNFKDRMTQAEIDSALMAQMMYELAAVRAREAKLRDALMDGVAHLAAAVSAYEKFVGRADRRGQRDPFFSTRFSDFTKAEERTRETLALPHDDSALKERLAQERERCAEECDRRYYDQGHECAAAIRAMGDKETT